MADLEEHCLIPLPATPARAARQSCAAGAPLRRYKRSNGHESGDGKSVGWRLLVQALVRNSA